MSKKKRLQKAQLQLAETELKAQKQAKRAERAAQTQAQLDEMKARRAERKAKKEQETAAIVAAGGEPPKKNRKGLKIAAVSVAAIVLLSIVVNALGDDENTPEANGAAVTEPATDDTDVAAEDEASETEDAEPDPEPEPELTFEDTILAINDTAEIANLDDDQIQILFQISDSLTMGMIRAAAHTETLEFLQAVEQSEHQPAEVRVVGNFPTADAYGNESDSLVLNVAYTAETLERINFDNIVVSDIWDIADSSYVHPDLAG